jgi:pimeloyl-ACP methyl ester carboxylesterase
LTNPRIIFVPGMKPKPPPRVHKRELLRTLVTGLAWARPDAARLLRDNSNWFTLVSWTHRFYGKYRDIALDLPGIERLLHQPEPSAEDLREIDSAARRVHRLVHLVGDALPFFGRLVARPELRLTMSEVLRYFSDDDGVASDIRGLLKTVLREAWRSNERVLLIGHSLGSVIAYDTLWELSRDEGETRSVELFITMGSPLATRFIRRSLRGADRSGAERYPANIERWVNFAAKGEMTALRPMRPYFSPMLDLGLVESIEDETELYNHFRSEIGLNVHMSYGYLVNPKVAERIGDWLLPAERPRATEAAAES